MAWSRHIPKAAGWYWFQGKAGQEPVDLEVIHLDYGDNGQLAPTSSFGFQESDLGKFEGYWEGPLEPSPFDQSKA
ncbi:MAG: hypothetical protein LZF60_360085 [Nitrospira sp.]|nr:MAG: hypothetical protein LZF60_360085 [Nitrospira sp.]